MASVWVLTLRLFLRNWSFMLQGFKVRLAQHGFQINKWLCVKGLLVACLVYCDLTKGPRNNIAQQQKKKKNRWADGSSRRDRKIPRSTMFTKNCPPENARTPHCNGVIVKVAKSLFSSHTFRNLTLEIFSNTQRFTSSGTSQYFFFLSDTVIPH